MSHCAVLEGVQRSVREPQKLWCPTAQNAVPRAPAQGVRINVQWHTVMVQWHTEVTSEDQEKIMESDQKGFIPSSVRPKITENCESQSSHRALKLTNWTTSIPAIRTPVSSSASNPSWSFNSSGQKGYTVVIPNMATQSSPSCTRGHLPVTLREKW